MDKKDIGKLRWSLIPWDALAGMVRVLEFGVKKYSENNWKHVKDGERRYRDAAHRHLIAIDLGEEIDAESGESHYSHALCSVLFALWHKMRSKR